MYNDEFEKALLEKIGENTPDETPHTFSRKYNRKKQHLLRSLNGKTRRFLRPALIIAAACLTITVAAAGAGVFHSNGFTGVGTDDHYQLHFDDTEGSPESITQLYNPSVPEEFSLRQYSLSHFSLYCSWFNGEKSIVFDQSPKKDYGGHFFGFDPEAREECTVNGHDGILLNDELMIVIWDNGDYIMELSTTCMTKEETLSIAESVAPCGPYYPEFSDEASPDTLEKKYLPQLEGFTAEAESTSRSAITKYSGRRDLTLCQYTVEGYTPGHDLSEFCVEYNEENGVNLRVFQWYNPNEYSVLWEYGGYVFELSSPECRDFTNENGYYNVTEDENDLMDLAMEIYHQLELENG